ncbi:MAG: hypothetical protein ACTSR8_03055 [Promethearchaeota archaeon]
MWYQVSGDPALYNYTWQEYNLSAMVAFLNTTAWNNAINGTVQIRFFANDSRNYVASVDCEIKRDVLGPLIAITNPSSNSLYGKVAPNTANFTVSFTDGNGIAEHWYMLYNASHTTDNYTWNGLIDQAVWDEIGNGTLTLRMYANDSLGNMNYEELILRKDIIPNENGEEEDEKDKKSDEKDAEPEQDILSFLVIGIILLVSIVGGIIAVIVVLKRRRNPYEYK